MGDEKLVFNGHRVSGGEDEQVLEMYKVVAVNNLFLELGMSLMGSAHLEII